MVEFFKDFQEVCLDKLTEPSGPALEMTANITSSAQMDLVLMGNVYGNNGLRSRYFMQQRDTLLRLTCSFQGRCRSDITEVAKSVKIPTMGMGFGGME